MDTKPLWRISRCRKWQERAGMYNYRGIIHKSLLWYIFLCPLWWKLKPHALSHLAAKDVATYPHYLVKVVYLLKQVLASGLSLVAFTHTEWQTVWKKVQVDLKSGQEAELLSFLVLAGGKHWFLCNLQSAKGKSRHRRYVNPDLPHSSVTHTHAHTPLYFFLLSDRPGLCVSVIGWVFCSLEDKLFTCVSTQYTVRQNAQNITMETKHAESTWTENKQEKMHTCISSGTL